MKYLVLLFLALVLVSSVPVAQVNTKNETPVVAEAKVETPVVAETKVETKVETPAVAETKVEAKPEAKVEAKVEAPVVATTEQKLEQKVEAKVETPVVASTETKAETKVESKVDVKQQALAQVMDFISQMAQPLGAEEKDALKDIISVGGEILMEAEKKMKELHNMPEVQNLIQGDVQTGLFGMKPDGSIDADAAASQMTEILSKMAPESNPLTAEEKSALHDLISGFSKAFAPTKETTESLQKDFEKIMESVTAPKTGKHDEALGATNLLSVFSDAEHGINTELLTQLTEKFLDSMEKQFNKEQH